jgi:hypothetical protein
LADHPFLDMPYEDEFVRIQVSEDGEAQAKTFGGYESDYGSYLHDKDLRRLDDDIEEGYKRDDGGYREDSYRDDDERYMPGDGYSEDYGFEDPFARLRFDDDMYRSRDQYDEDGDDEDYMFNRGPMSTMTSTMYQSRLKDSCIECQDLDSLPGSSFELLYLETSWPMKA